MTPADQQALARVMIVDDDEICSGLLMTTLQDSYQVNAVASGEDCLAQVSGFDPQVVLLDISMPGIDGYETCRRLREDAANRGRWIIFVSSKDAPEEKITGYDAGGNDYVVKPLDPNEIRRKLDAAMRAIGEIDASRENAQAAMQTAMTAMTASSELGVVFQFLSDSARSAHHDELADEVLKAVAQYGLRAVVQIRSPHAIITRNQERVYNGLEEQLLLTLQEADRIVEFGGKLAVNYPTVSLLILDPPWDEPERVGRMRDNLAKLVEGAVARVAAIDQAYLVQLQQDMLSRMIARTRKVLGDIASQHSANKQASRAALDQLLVQIEASFMSLGLTAEQETQLIDLAQGAVRNALAPYEEGLRAEQELAGLVAELESFV